MQLMCGWCIRALKSAPVSNDSPEMLTLLVMGVTTRQRRGGALIYTNTERGRFPHLWFSLHLWFTDFEQKQIQSPVSSQYTHSPCEIDAQQHF